MGTKIVNVDLDTWFANDLGGAGNGKGDRAKIGMGTSSWNFQSRTGIRLPRPTTDFATIPVATQITDFDVYLQASSDLGGIGGTVKFYLERSTGTFTENSEDRREYISTVGPASSEWPPPAIVTTDRGEYSGSPGNGTWMKVSMLALGRWWHAHPEVTSLYLIARPSNGSGGYDDSATSRRVTVKTSESSSGQPYAELKWTSDLAPLIPTDMAPADGSKIPSIAGTDATVSARHTHPEGKTSTAYQVQWCTAGTTDAQADAGTGILKNSGTVSSSTANNAIRSYTFTNLAARTSGEWRMRFQYNGLWGPYSLLVTGTTAWQPSVVNPATEPGTLTPDFLDSISSGDSGDFITAYEDVVYQDPSAGSTITKWATGKVAVGGSPTRVSRQYAGDALVYLTPYRRRRRLWNRDDIPTTSDATWPTSAIDVPFTPSQAVGPTIKIGSSAGPVFDVSTKIDDLTLTLNLSDPGSSNIDQIRVFVENEAGTLLHDSLVVSFASAANRDYTLPAGVLDWGMNPKVWGQIRLTGAADMGTPSVKAEGHVNARPGSPSPVVISGGQTVHRPDGVWVTTDSTPDALFTFRDTDIGLGYTESPARQEVEVRTLAEAHFGASPYIDSTTPAQTFTLPALTIETTYKVRANYDDTAAARSDFSGYEFVKYSAAPTLSAVTPANAATITDPTPSFAWTFASTGGKAQAGYSLVARVGSTELYNSGYVAGTAATHVIPAVDRLSPLPDATVVTWDLTVYDSDGLSVLLTRTFTTDFTQPAALTGLTVDPDMDSKALVVRWDISALSDAEFYGYLVYEKPAGAGQFRLVVVLTDKTATSVLVRSAPHNRETIIRVTQSNAFMESEPAESSAILGLDEDTGEGSFIDGYWDVGDDGAYVIEHVSGYGGDTVTNLEILSPPGRGEKVLLDWGSTGYEGSFQIWTSDPDTIARLRSYKEAGEVRLLKTYHGSSRYVRYTTVPDTDLAAGYVSARVGFVQVLPTNLPF